MTNTGKARLAHEIIDDMADGYIPDHDDLETLRSFLPDLPAQKTLEEIIEELKQVWGETVSNRWPEETHGTLETWLWEHHKQLEGLKGTAPKPSQASPRLPEGMRLATHPINGLCVVSPNSDDEGDHRIFYLSDNVRAGADSRWVSSDVLTFLDVEEPHPEFLVGEADYRHAPEGTVVAYKKSVPFIKWNGNWQAIMADHKPFTAEMGTVRRSVLRWGYGNE